MAISVWERAHQQAEPRADSWLSRAVLCCAGVRFAHCLGTVFFINTLIIFIKTPAPRASRPGFSSGRQLPPPLNQPRGGAAGRLPPHGASRRDWLRREGAGLPWTNPPPPPEGGGRGCLCGMVRPSRSPPPFLFPRRESRASARPLPAPARAQAGPRGLPFALPDGGDSVSAPVPPAERSLGHLLPSLIQRADGSLLPHCLRASSALPPLLLLRRLTRAARGGWARGARRAGVLAARQTRQVSRGGAGGGAGARGLQSDGRRGRDGPGGAAM